MSDCLGDINVSIKPVSLQPLLERVIQRFSLQCSRSEKKKDEGILITYICNLSADPFNHLVIVRVNWRKRIPRLHRFDSIFPFLSPVQPIFLVQVLPIRLWLIFKLRSTVQNRADLKPLNSSQVFHRMVCSSCRFVPFHKGSLSHC